MSAKAVPTARFRLGRIVVKPHALLVLTQDDILIGIARHQAGDWGEVPAEHRAANDRALLRGAGIVSAYRSAQNVKFWLITEADRSATTILLPMDY